MERGGKIALFGITVVGLGGIAYWVMNEEKKEESPIAIAPQLPTPIYSTPEPIDEAKLNQHIASRLIAQLSPLKHNRCGMISSVNTPTGSGKQYVGIHVNSPRPNKGDIVEGDLVRLQNTNSNIDGEYRVLGTWIDAKGKVGAVDINHDYPARGSGENKKDMVFNGTKSSLCY